MAKRRVTNRLSGRLSGNKTFGSFTGSGYLDPDTNILGEDKTLWWKHLGEETIPRHSSTYNHGNESTVDLSFNSDVTSTRDKSNWWKHLEFEEQNASTSKQHNYSAGIIKTHVMETSTSDSEKELKKLIHTKKRKLPRRAASRKSDSNPFLSALNDTTISFKQANAHSHNDTVDKKVLQRKSLKNKTDNSSLETENTMEALQLHHKNDSITVSTQSIQNIDKIQESSDKSDSEMLRTVNLKSRILLRRAASRKSDSNAFLSALNDTTVSLKQANAHSRNDAVDKKVLQRKSLKNKTDNSSLEIENMMEASQLRHKHADSVTVSTQSTQNIDKNQESSDESDSEMLRTMPVKRKSRFLLRKRQSSTNNAFKDVLSEDANTTYLSTEIPISQPINIGNAKVSLTTRSSNNLNQSRRSIDRSNSNIEKNNTSLSRSSRHDSLPKDTSSQHVDTYDAKSLSSVTKSRSLVVPSNKFNDESISFGRRSSRHISIRKDNPNQDIEFSDAVSLSVAGSQSSAGSPKQLASRSKSNIDIDKNISLNRSVSRRTSIPKDNLNQDIEFCDAVSPSVTGSQSLAGSSKQLASRSKSNIDTDKNISLNRSVSRCTSIPKDNLNQDEFCDAVSPSVTRSQSLAGSPKRLASRSKSNIDINKNISLNRSISKRTSIPKNNLNQDIEFSDGVSPSVTGSQSPIGSSKTLARVSKSRIDTNKNMSIGKNIMDASKDNPSQKALDTSDEENQNNDIVEMERSSRGSTESNANRPTENVALLVETEKHNHQHVLSVSQNRTRKSKLPRSTLSIASYLNKDSQRENTETSRREKSSKENDLQNHSVPIRKPLNESTTAFNIGKIVKAPRTIDTFFRQSSSTADKQSSSNNQNAVFSQDFNEKMERIKPKLEEIKNREINVMKGTAMNDKKESASNARSAMVFALKQAATKIPVKKTTRTVDKAFLVNGKVYRAPRLPRPKHWATDNLYQFLWKRMESKYKLTTRIKSEKFVQELAKIVSFIERRTKYENYKRELEALMKEMARLGIIRTRNDFYDFCFQFLPYGFRLKVVPMLLPGNKKNIPYDPEKLHTPLLDNEE